MSHEHELSKYQRNDNRMDLPKLLEMGKEYQAKVNWQPPSKKKTTKEAEGKDAGEGKPQEARS